MRFLRVLATDFFSSRGFRAEIPWPRRSAAWNAALFLLLLAGVPLQAQPDSTNGWGYPYDSLLVDLHRWRQNPLARVDSIGASVQNRPLWMVTVGDVPGIAKPRVFVHARTHPVEVQSFYVAREMLLFLLDTTAQAAQLRAEFTFHFVPMYNPDGVVIGSARRNANGVDLEGNWNAPNPEPEVIALRARFQALSTGPGAIRVALNLHSDQVNCTRFFFFHAAAGTSGAYAELQREYITGVRSYFPEGIQPWHYVVSWTNGFQPQYPESFWWLTRREAVMALTYEDTNCPGAGDFHRTARALVLGSVDYMRSHPPQLAEGGGAVRKPRLELGPAGPVISIPAGGGTEYRDVRGRVVVPR